MIIWHPECDKKTHWVVIAEIEDICRFLRKTAKEKDKTQIFVCAAEIRCLCRVLKKVDIPFEELGAVLSVLHHCLRMFPSISISEAYQSIREKVL